MGEDTSADFASAVDQCSALIEQLQREAGLPTKVRWFRAPHGKYTRTMQSVIKERELENVMCDTYASCPVVTDGDFIGNFLTNRAQDGSIILLHMPERGFREWCLQGLEILLEGLERRGLVATT